jgi:hypothetical protein
MECVNRCLTGFQQQKQSLKFESLMVRKGGLPPLKIRYTQCLIHNASIVGGSYFVLIRVNSWIVNDRRPSDSAAHTEINLPHQSR